MHRLRWLLLLLPTWALLAVGLDLSGQGPVPVGTYDAIIVAGCRVMPDGRPSDCLTRRAQAGALLWRGGLAPTLLFTGGVGEFGESEAQVAARVAEASGVRRAAILLEDRSTSTEENARFASELLGRNARILLVTDAWHTHRARRVFARYFDLVEPMGTTSPPWTRSRGALREVAAIGWYGARGRL